MTKSEKEEFLKKFDKNILELTNLRNEVSILDEDNITLENLQEFGMKRFNITNELQELIAEIFRILSNSYKKPL